MEARPRMLAHRVLAGASARRVHDLPACVALFRQGRLTEDAMGLIVPKAPGSRDGDSLTWLRRCCTPSSPGSFGTGQQHPPANPSPPAGSPRTSPRPVVVERALPEWCQLHDRH